jgi:hypothetical protein
MPDLMNSGNSSKSRLQPLGSNSVVAEADLAARSFSLMPPTGST